MRLGQLARKLSLRPSEIIEFLASRNISVEDGGNTKIEDEHVSLIINRFAPGTEEAIAVEATAQEETPAEPAMVERPTEVLDQRLVHPDEQPDVAEEVSEKPDIIKASKVELSGLKVLGKIELPEKKKPEDSREKDNVADPVKNELAERKAASPRRGNSVQRSSKNPVALGREQEALEAKKKMEAEAERQKERRTQNYLKKVKGGQPTKAIKLVQEETEQMSESELAEPPKTWWGKLVRWFTT